MFDLENGGLAMGNYFYDRGVRRTADTPADPWVLHAMFEIQA